MPLQHLVEQDAVDESAEPDAEQERGLPGSGVRGRVRRVLGLLAFHAPGLPFRDASISRRVQTLTAR